MPAAFLDRETCGADKLIVGIDKTTPARALGQAPLSPRRRAIKSSRSRPAQSITRRHRAVSALERRRRHRHFGTRLERCAIGHLNPQRSCRAHRHQHASSCASPIVNSDAHTSV
jgi:hypothetical protein